MHQIKCVIFFSKIIVLLPAFQKKNIVSLLTHYFYDLNWHFSSINILQPYNGPNRKHHVLKKIRISNTVCERKRKKKNPPPKKKTKTKRIERAYMQYHPSHTQKKKIERDK